MIEDAIALANSARDANPPRYEDAHRAYKLAAKLEPKDPRPYIGLGNILFDQKRYAEAAKAYLKALKLGVPKDVSGAGKPPKGAQDAGNKAAYRIYPPYIFFINSYQGGELHAYVGVAFIQNRGWAKAESEFAQAIAQENKKSARFPSLKFPYNKHAQWYA
ncbi:MAG: tetratricopeptide repeat protein, partial [Pyrinomonadaceae bacterium]